MHLNSNSYNSRGTRWAQLGAVAIALLVPVAAAAQAPPSPTPEPTPGPTPEPAPEATPEPTIGAPVAEAPAVETRPTFTTPAWTSRAWTARASILPVPGAGHANSPDNADNADADNADDAASGDVSPAIDVSAAISGDVSAAISIDAPDASADPAGEPPDASADPAGETPDDALELDEGEVIVITGSRVEQRLATTTVATEVITRKEITASGAANVAEILEEHPGIEINHALRGSAIRIQGLNPDYVLILVDGQRTIGRIDGAIDLESYPVENIERIEIVKGASSALYGSDAIAGVVNIITRQSARPAEAEVDIKYGGLGRVDVGSQVGLRQGGWNTRVSGGYHRGDGYDLDPSDEHTSASAFQEWQTQGRASYTRGPMALSVTADYLRKDLAGIDVDNVGGVYDRLNSAETASASVRGQFDLARNRSSSSASEAVTPARRLTTTLRHALYRDQFAYDQRGAEELDVYEESKERLTEASAQLDTGIGARHYVIAGLEGMTESLESPRLNDPETGDAAGQRYRVAMYTQDEWIALADPSIIVVPGVRLEYDTQYGFHPTPKLAARWDASERVIVRGSYGRGYRAPRFQELYLLFENPSVGYVVVGNPDLEPETSHSVNAGAELRVSKRVWAAVNLFYNDVDNLILFDLVSDGEAGEPMRFAYVNIAAATTRGVESQVRLRPRLGPIEGVQVELGYTLTDANDNTEERPLPGVAMHRLSFKLGYEHPRGLAAQVRGNVVGERPFFFEERTDADPYVTLDARVGQTVLTRFTLFAGANNLLDAGDPLLLPIPPRTFYGGMLARY